MGAYGDGNPKGSKTRGQAIADARKTRASQRKPKKGFTQTAKQKAENARFAANFPF